MPDLFREWQQPTLPSPEAIAEAYAKGFAGAVYSREEIERFQSEQPNPNGEAVCHAIGIADTAAGKLVPTWVAVEKTYPGCWPASAQERGDCVSHDTRNAMLTTLVGEVVAGIPDAVTGKTEEAPAVSPEAQRDGVLSTEAIYRHRGSRGDGWSCTAAARVATSKTGAVLRQNYPGIADLTRYDSRWAGGSADSKELAAFGSNLFREATRLDSFEGIRDLLNRGFGVSSCGSEGFSDKRDENGVSRKQGSWAHAMAIIGADDRAETHSKYGGPLLLVLNSWGTRWNSGPRTVMGTQLEIPVGSFWAKWSDLSRRDYYAIAGLNGWQRKELPDYLGGW